MKRKALITASWIATLAIAGCTSGEDDDTPPGTDPPEQMDVTMVAEGGFDTPLDAVASPDGSTFYFTAFTQDDESLAAVYQVSASGGEPSVLHAGAPLSFPSGLVMSCDGGTLFVSDASVSTDDDDVELEQDGGALYALDVASGTLTAIDAPAIGTPAGLAISEDCETLYVAGQTPEEEAALFRMPVDGGDVEIVYQGEPLVSPTGMYVDRDDVAWVLDHVGEDGDGVLYAITTSGEISAVVTDLALGTPGGCSLNSTGDTAFMPTTNDDGEAVLTTVSLADASTSTVTTPGVVSPAGLRTARDAAVFALVDHEGDSIHLAK